MSQHRSQAAKYYQEVDDLTHGLRDEERRALMEDLSDQLTELPDDSVQSRLGSPREYVADYLDGIGIQRHSSTLGANRVATTVSLLAIPGGIIALLSFGGQLVFALPVLVAEWLLARISPRPLRVIWTCLAALLAGIAAYVAVGEIASSPDEVMQVVVGILAAAVTGWLFIRRTWHCVNLPETTGSS